MHEDMIQQNLAPLPLTEIGDTGAYDIHPYLPKITQASNLCRSIQLVGVLSPPIVLELKSGDFEIICGRQRLHCWKLLDQSHGHFRILPKHSKRENILTLLLEDQFTNGQLNIIEQACFLKLCRDHLPEDDRYQPFIHNLPSGRITKGLRFLEPLTEVDANLQFSIHIGSISEKIVTELLSFNEEDRLQFMQLASKLQLGANNQKKLIQQLGDILRRENISMMQFVNQKAITNILNDGQGDLAAKTVALQAIIQRFHKPRLSAAQDTFATLINSLNLPENCRLNPSRSFETERVTLTVQFDNYSRFTKKWKNLSKIINEE